MVVATTPNTTVPVRVDPRQAGEDAERHGRRARSRSRNAAARRRRAAAIVTRPGAGNEQRLRNVTQNITPDVARRLRLENAKGAADHRYRTGSPAARAGLQPGDVIIRVGRTPVASAPTRQRELGSAVGWHRVPPRPAERHRDVRVDYQGVAARLRRLRDASG